MAFPEHNPLKKKKKNTLEPTNAFIERIDINTKVDTDQQVWIAFMDYMHGLHRITWIT